MAGRKTFVPERAVDAAMLVFWGKGYAATSTQDLVESTGLGRGSLYNAFASKHALFEQVLRRYGDRMLAHQRGTLDAEGHIRERVRTMLMEVVEEETSTGCGRRGCLAVNTALELAGSDPGAEREVEQIVLRMHTALRTAFDAARRAGDIDSDRDPEVLASSVLTTMYGLRVLGDALGRQALVDVVDTAVRTL